MMITYDLVLVHFSGAQLSIHLVGVTIDLSYLQNNLCYCHKSTFFLIREAKVATVSLLYFVYIPLSIKNTHFENKNSITAVF